ncbi:MAG TPA: lmo0937 family membrane protein [Polyangiaceae bacterium]|nr:lmo0937 family membrane protein [Polyangiaceae bacterium]
MGKRPKRRDLITITPNEDKTMNLLWVVAVVFFVLWMLGFAAFHVTSGFIHLLLVVALVAVVFRLVTGHRTA